MPNTKGKGKGFQGRCFSRGKPGHTSKERKGKVKGNGAFNLQGDGCSSDRNGWATWSDYSNAWGGGSSDVSSNYSASVMPQDAWMMC